MRRGKEILTKKRRDARSARKFPSERRQKARGSVEFTDFNDKSTAQITVFFIITEIVSVGKGQTVRTRFFFLRFFRRRGDLSRSVACGAAFFAYNGRKSGEAKRRASFQTDKGTDVGNGNGKGNERKTLGVSARRRDGVRADLSAGVLDLRRANRRDGGGRRRGRVSRAVGRARLRGVSTSGERSGADVLPTLRSGRDSGNGSRRRRALSVLFAENRSVEFRVRRSSSDAFLPRDDAGARFAVEADRRPDVGGGRGAALLRVAASGFEGVSTGRGRSGSDELAATFFAERQFARFFSVGVGARVGRSLLGEDGSPSSRDAAAVGGRLGGAAGERRGRVRVERGKKRRLARTFEGKTDFARRRRVHQRRDCERNRRFAQRRRRRGGLRRDVGSRRFGEGTATLTLRRLQGSAATSKLRLLGTLERFGKNKEFATAARAIASPFLSTAFH